MTPFPFQERQLDENQLLELIFSKNEKNRDNAFWSELSECDGDMHDMVLNLYSGCRPFTPHCCCLSPCPEKSPSIEITGPMESA
jgi:hypothetical protein